ncbi:MAG: S41 family peptidase [Bacteroidales bacterium]|nr:S41 family peptidase [Bacteroidales bacterium]
MNKIKYFAPLFATMLAVAFSCSKSDDISYPNIIDSLKVEKAYVKSIMNDYYFWYKEVPQDLIALEYKDVESYFTDFLVDEDRWSWMMNGKEFIEMQTGVYESYGFQLKQAIEIYDDYGVRVSFVYPNSPMSEQGVTRGCMLTHLNGTPVETLIRNGTFNNVLSNSTNSFTFLNPKGQSMTFTTSAREIQTVSVLKNEVITPAMYPGLPHNVGYMIYMSFTESMQDELDAAFAELAGVGDLVLDLRYNGGGDMSVMQYLAGYLAPASANNQVLYKTTHNDRYSIWDASYRISRNTQALDLSRLFVLTSDETASASEAIINGMDPLFPGGVFCIGDTTYGKPNGMYVLAYPKNKYDNPDYVFLPICFFNENQNGEGNYTEGLLPDSNRGDDLFHDFGVEEDNLRAALYYIANGSFPAGPEPSVSFKGRPGSVLKQEAPRGGLYTKLPEGFPLSE